MPGIRPRSILSVTTTFPSHPGDREGNFVHDSVEGLVEAGTDVSILVTRPFIPWPVAGWLGRSASAIRAAAFPGMRTIETVSRLSLPRHALKTVSNASLDDSVLRGAERLSKQGSFDLVHGHGEELAWPVAAVARRMGIASVVTIHGQDTAMGTMGSRAQRGRYGRALSAVDRVVLVGEPLRAVFRELAGRDEHFRVVPNGFRPPPPGMIHARARSPGAVERMRFISVSNLNEGKGIDVSLEALSRLWRDGFRNWSLDVVGDGGQRRSLQEQAKHLGIADRVQFLGARPHAEVYGILGRSHVFVLPSYREAFGIAYLEAMAMGLLAIGVRGQGPEAFIRDGSTGLLVPPRDPVALAAVLKGVLAGPDTWRTIANRGRDEVWGKWTWAAHAQALLAVYDEAIREHPR